MTAMRQSSFRKSSGNGSLELDDDDEKVMRKSDSRGTPNVHRYSQGHCNKNLGV